VVSVDNSFVAKLAYVVSNVFISVVVCGVVVAVAEDISAKSTTNMLCSF